MFYRHLLGGPTVQGNDPGPSGDDATLRRRLGVRNPVGPSDRDQLRVRIHRRPGIDVRFEFPHLGGVLRGANRLDLTQAKGAIQENQPRVKMPSLEVNDPGIGCGEPLPDGDDFRSLDQHLARGQRPAGNGVNHGIFEKNRLGSASTDCRTDPTPSRDQNK